MSDASVAETSDLRGTGLHSAPAPIPDVRRLRTIITRADDGSVSATAPADLSRADPGVAVTVPILPTIQDPADLRGLDEVQLAQLAVEIRDTIVRTVARTGGHLGSSLGVVELTIALHRLLESPRDRIVWDTGHQAYPHKLLTGRLERFGTLRQLDGIGGFPRRSESAHDVFDGGHAGTGLSIAEGLAEARDLRHGLERIAVVVGDAALMSGLSLEALNDIGQRQTQMLIVLNDNEMSISPTVGAFSKYLSKIKLSRDLAAGQERLRPDRRADPGRRRNGPRAEPRLRAVGRQLRPAGPAVRGPRDHLHRRRARATTCMPCSRRSAGRSRCPDRPSSTSGPRRAAASARPRRDQVGFHGAALPPIAMAPATPTRTTARGAGDRCRPNRWPTTPRRRPSSPRRRRSTRTTPRSSRPS